MANLRAGSVSLLEQEDLMARYTRTLACAGGLALVAMAALPAGANAGPKPPGHGGKTTSSSPSTTSATGSFTNYQVAETTGTTCPGNANCSNFAAEPAIRADNAGNFYATSENGLGGGTIAVKSTDGGLHYTTLASPDGVSSFNTTGFAPGGGDTDVATAPVINPDTKQYNVYVASLSLANIDVSTSVDGGKTWSLNPVGAMVPGDDREWIAADGPSKVCVSYHDVATSNIDVNCSFDAGMTFTQLGDAIDPAHAFLINNNEIGNLTIDPTSHTIYQLFSGIHEASELVGSQLGTVGYHTVWAAVSTNGGRTFTDYPVYNSPHTGVSYGHQFVNVSLDTGGNAYALYSDDHNLFYSYSTNKGTVWSKAQQVNSGPSKTAIMPWSVAGSAGKLDVVWYGSDYYDGTNPPDSYPNTAHWYVYFAQNTNAASGGGFTQVQASPLIHTGGVCEGGISCTGNRDLYDDFGVAASPVTGLASIIYSDDQYDPSGPNNPYCTPSQTNTGSCDHTNIATQTSGTRIY